jgi:hypothetical protein
VSISHFFVYLRARKYEYLLLYVWPQFTNPKFRANSGPTSNGAKPFFMVSCTSLMVELVHETIKYGLAPLEVGTEFALNSKV